MSSLSVSWRVVQAALVVVVFAYFIYSAFQPVAAMGPLQPLPLFVVLWVLTIPFKGQRGHGYVLGIAGVITFVRLLATTGNLLAPFVLAAALAYVLDPVVDRLERGRVPRSVAILALTLPALGILALVVTVALPAAIRQMGGVLQDVPQVLDGLRGFLITTLTTRNIPLVDEDALLTRLSTVDSDAVAAFLAQRQEELLAWLWSGVLGLGRGLGTLLSVLGFAALTPVLTYYLLRDWDRCTAFVASLVPSDRRQTAIAFARDCDRIVSRYMRSQILVASMMGALTGLGLLAFGFPYAGTLGLLVAIFSVLPYVGLLLSILPAIIIALTGDSVGGSLLVVAGVYGGTQILESTVIGPRIASESVGLHPVWVVLAITMGGFFFGFVGLLLAVPAAAVVRLVLTRTVERYQKSTLFLGSQTESQLES